VIVERVLIAIESTLLGLWAGAMAGFAFVFAPIAIGVVGNLQTFAALVASVIRGLATFGAICGSFAALTAVIRSSVPQAHSLALARTALVALALAATAYETNVIIPHMEATAKQIPGALDSVEKDDPRRVAYDGQHALSTRVYGLAFLCVVSALTLVPFGRRPAK